MPIAFRFGSRRASRSSWRACDRPRSRPGPRARPRPNPFTQLIAGLRALVRFDQAHPDWFPQDAEAPDSVGKPALDPEWEAAIHRVYHGVPVASSSAPAASSPADAAPPDCTTGKNTPK